MQARYFLCCLLLLIAAVHSIEARGGGGGGRAGGLGGGLFSGWFKSSKSSSSSSSSSASSSIARTSSTSNGGGGGGKSNRRSYTPSIIRPYSGYRSMSYPSYNSGYNNGYNSDPGYPYQSLDNDAYAGFSTGMQTTRYVNDLMQLLRMRLPNDYPDASTEETFTISPARILEVDRSMNISAFFDLIKPISDKIFERMGARLAQKRRVTTQPPTTTTTPASQEEIKVASHEKIEQKESGTSFSEEAVTERKRSAFIGSRIKTTAPNISTASTRDTVLFLGNIDNVYSATEIPVLQQQSTENREASKSETIQQKQPDKIFNVTLEIV